MEKIFILFKKLQCYEKCGQLFILDNGITNFFKTNNNNFLDFFLVSDRENYKQPYISPQKKRFTIFY